LESAPVPLDLRIGGETVLATRALPTFYEQRVYKPAWLSGLEPLPAAIDLLAFLGSVDREGLRAENYHGNRVRALLEASANSSLPPPAKSLAELDLLLTDSFLMLGAHLVSGQVDPSSFEREWVAVRREADLIRMLDSALEDGDIQATLYSLLPQHPGYYRLRDMGEHYRRLADAGGWQLVSAGPPFELGDTGARVAELERRLSATDDLEANVPGLDLAIFDDRTEAAVRRFQIRHGLDADGVVGTKTLAALNVSVSQRLEQIYLNLERWRWLPQSLGERYVLVNLPAFALQAVEAGKSLLEMRVAVGRPYRSTPVFSDTIRYLVFNPYWEIPASIAVRDKLPEVRKDITYLSKQGIRVLSGWGSDQQEISQAGIDWSSFSSRSFPYRLRQDPGPLNALGRVKFMFPNRFNVYLHDTPGREVFKRTERDVSSGCIRLERPLELAELLLRNNRGWQPATLQEYLRDYQERTIRLDTPWPVHLLHWTAWVDENQVAHFRPDLYDRDGRLSKALLEARPQGAF
jgi:murein L,D-transpeptidase YcbB/YkuD